MCNCPCFDVLSVAKEPQAFDFGPAGKISISSNDRQKFIILIMQLSLIQVYQKTPIIY